MRKLRLFLLLMIFAMLLGGCGKEEITEGETVVYHLNKDGTSIVPVAYEITGDSPEVRVEEFFAKLEEVPETVEEAEEDKANKLADLRNKYSR